MHGDALTVTGRTMAENLADVDPPDLDGKVVRAMSRPIHRTGGLTILRGSLAPQGAVVKVAGIDVDRFEGRARVFDGEDAASVHQRFAALLEEVLDEIDKGVLNLNIEQWQRDFEEPEIAETLEQDDLLAVQRRITAEPAGVVTGPRRSRELGEASTLVAVREVLGAGSDTRAGEMVDAREVGSDANPPVDLAPGQYVRAIAD